MTDEIAEVMAWLRRADDLGESLVVSARDGRGQVEVIYPGHILSIIEREHAARVEAERKAAYWNERFEFQCKMGDKAGMDLYSAMMRAESAERELTTLRARPCPYVHSSREGTHYCTLPHVAERERDELRGLARFGLMLFDRSRDEAWCGDVDAVDVQNYALECGLIAPRVVKEPCGANGCPCEPGDECFWETEHMTKARQRVAIVRIGEGEA